MRISGGHRHHVEVDAEQGDGAALRGTFDHRSVRILGRGGLGMRLLGAAGIALPLLLTYLEASNPAGAAPLSKLVTDWVGFGLVLAFMVNTMTSRIEARRADLVLVNWFTVAVIPANCVLRVDRENGLEILTTLGTRFRHIGYGSSVIANFTGNRRARQAASEIDAWLDTQRHEHRPLSLDAPQVRTVRVTWLLGLSLICVTSTVVLGLVLYHLL